MGLFEYAVMGALSRQPDRTLQLKELARLTSGSLSRLSHVMNRLEQRGWVRRRSAGTGRATDAVLTELGHQKLAEATPGHMAEVRRLVFDVLTPEQIAALEEITERINAAIGAPLGSSSTD